MVQGIDADPELLFRALGVLLEIGADHVPRDHLPVVGNRILQVEDQRVGRIAASLLELALAVAGDEEPGADNHAGRFIIRPVRTQ